MTEQELNDIKNALLRYSLEDVSDNFQHLTRTERNIIGDQKTYDALLQSINPQGGK